MRTMWEITYECQQMEFDGPHVGYSSLWTTGQIMTESEKVKDDFILRYSDDEHTRNIKVTEYELVEKK